MSSHISFEQKGYEISQNILFDTCEVFEKNNIAYHLEGGTLLGIVRDHQLIPWDHDLDISIMRSQTNEAVQVLKEQLPKKWRLSYRYHTSTNDLWKAGDLRAIKVKDRKYYFMPGQNRLDIFMKACDDKYAYWEAGEFIMRADKSHYEGREMVDFLGRSLSAPNNYSKYLTDKYGDWSKPDKNWHHSQEKTIISDA